MEGIAGSAAACDPSALFPLFEDGSERVAKVTALDYSELADADNVSDRRPPPHAMRAGHEHNMPPRPQDLAWCRPAN
jgi:hypothetical protein